MLYALHWKSFPLINCVVTEFCTTYINSIHIFASRFVPNLYRNHLYGLTKTCLKNCALSLSCNDPIPYCMTIINVVRPLGICAGKLPWKTCPLSVINLLFLFAHKLMLLLYSCLFLNLLMENELSLFGSLSLFCLP